MDETLPDLMSESELRKSDEEASIKEPTKSASGNESVCGRQKTHLVNEFTGSDSNLGSSGDGILSESERQDSVADDESSNNGFIVIKPSSATTQKDLENTEDEGNQSASDMIVIQNSSEISLEVLDAAVLTQVQRALEESGMEHSVMIVNGDDDTDIEKQTSYVIDLNTESQSQEPDLNVAGSKRPPSPVRSTVASQASSKSLFSKLVASSLIQDNISQTISSQEQEYTSSLLNTSVTQSDSVTMSFCPDNSESSLNSLASAACDHSDMQVKTLIKTPVVSLDNPFSKSSTPKNLCHVSSSQDQSNSHSSLMDEKHASTSTTSHVAEQLLNIAKKMIGEGGSTSQRISVDETMSKIVISPEQKSFRDKNTESIITMYLSSPNELKSKLEKFKTDSPVIIVQAGEEPLTEEEDNEDEENPENIKPEKKTASIREDVNVNTENSINITELTSPRSSDSITSQSDSLAAALSSFTADSVLYSCSECGYSSHNKHYYKQHVDLVHNEDRPYKCPHCDYAGKRRHALLEHMVVHSDQRPYTCNYCNASFRKKGHLTNHIKLHTSQRLVPCGVCNIQFPDAEAFESHLRKIHNTDKLYKCKLCDHTVVDRQSMLNHLSSHNESAIFNCPNCSSDFHEEKALLDHLKETHGIIKVSEETSSSSSDLSMAGKTATASANEVKAAQQANIICTECGFMCADAQVMKKHMWVHIDSSSDMNVQIKGQAPSQGSSPAPNSNAMNVLKMNVVSGLKTLPDNVMYQCTSCNFTSSDNSVFIKHMLLHKTQRKSHTPVTKSELPSDENETVSSDKSQGKTISVLSNASQLLAKGTDKGKSTSNVPFVFDQSSGRFRCLICGYHCDYQRTIKAHIWKHSGHQNIEYPVFDQTKKGEVTEPLPTTMGNAETQQKAPMALTAPTAPLPSVSTRSVPVPIQPVQLLKTSSGDIVKLLPVDPKTSKYKPGDLIQIKDNAIIVSEKCEKDSPADLFLKTLTVPVKVKSENMFSEAPADVVAKDVQIEADEVFKFDTKKESSLLNQSSCGVLQDKKSQMNKGEPCGKSPQDEDGCTEPSVVVEIVDTVPSVLGLTGLKSQQGSPRVSDLECSGGEMKLSIALKEAFSPEKPSSEGCHTPQKEEESSKCKYNLRKPKDSKVAKSPSHLQDESSTSELLVNDSKEIEIVDSKDVQIDTKHGPGLNNPEVDEESEILNNAESDTTESSDEIGSAGESGSTSNPPKTGICSSLLAVIEQLRERSRSEGEKSVSPTKELPKRVGKRNKKHNTHADTAPLSEFHNIEKIDAGDGEKYRCSLCHYTSQRICNMRIHMKTHRQKKPSECSLCDFSSSIPEALQEHMLQHCKVRTYACKFCPQNFNHKSTLRAHMRAHKDKEPYLCAYCVFEASTSTELKEHMQVHSGCSSRLRCPGCDHIMNNKEELTSHLMKCTGKGDYSTVLTVSDTKSMDELQDQKSPGSSVSESTNASLPVTSISNPVTTVATEHACVVRGCSFTSFSLKELQEHLSVHCNPSLLLCDLCDFKALHSRSLKSHMKRHANDQRYVQQPLEQYKCNLCGYVCHHLPSLKSHMWRHASDQSYSYEFTNDVINAAIDHDSRIDANAGEADDPELLDRVINSERRIMEGELTKSGQGDGQRPTCWVTFRCCSCGFETINKAKLNIHMRSHSDIIKQTLDGMPSKLGPDKSNYASAVALAFNKSTSKRSNDAVENDEPFVPMKVRKAT